MQENNEFESMIYGLVSEINRIGSRIEGFNTQLSKNQSTLEYMKNDFQKFDDRNVNEHKEVYSLIRDNNIKFREEIIAVLAPINASILKLQDKHDSFVSRKEAGIVATCLTAVFGTVTFILKLSGVL